MAAPRLTANIKDMMKVKKEIDTEDQVEGPARIVKLRFTAKQFAGFREACTVFKLLSDDAGFNDYVKSVLGSDIRTPTIEKQLVQPITSAPLKIPMKLYREPKNGEEPREKKETYFTKPIPVTPDCERLYQAASQGGDMELRLNVANGSTCVTDVRVMVGKYIALKDLRGKEGITIDSLLQSLGSRSLKENSEYIRIVDNCRVIPKGDRKIVQGIVNDVAFGKGKK